MLLTMHRGLPLPPSHAPAHQAGHPTFPDARGTAPISLTPRGTVRFGFGVSVTLFTPQRLSSAVQSPRAFPFVRAQRCRELGKLGSWEKAAGLFTAGLHVAVLWVLATQGVEKQTVGTQSSTKSPPCKHTVPPPSLPLRAAGLGAPP